MPKIFSPFYEDLTYMPRRKFSAKYILPPLIAFLIMVIIGQLITQFITLNQLNKASGKIVYVEKLVKSYTHHRGLGSGYDTPDSALFITLDNMQVYDVQEQKDIQRLQPILHSGDFVTIYYPTHVIKIISAGFIRDICQIERGNQVLYSWQDQQKENWFLIAILTVAAVSFYMMLRFFRSAIETPKL